MYLTKDTNKISTLLSNRNTGSLYLKFDNLNNLRLMGAFLGDNLKVVRTAADHFEIVPLYHFNGSNIPYNKWLQKIKTGVFEVGDLEFEDHQTRRIP